MITPEELEHIDWLITVNERRAEGARKVGKSTLGDVYARAAQEAKELKEILLIPDGTMKEIIDKIRKPATL